MWSSVVVFLGEMLGLVGGVWVFVTECGDSLLGFGCAVRVTTHTWKSRSPNQDDGLLITFASSRNTRPLNEYPAEEHNTSQHTMLTKTLTFTSSSMLEHEPLETRKDMVDACMTNHYS